MRVKTAKFSWSCAAPQTSNKDLSNKKRLNFPKITKIDLKKKKKMQVSKATSSIRRLFASLDIHYNNSLNTEKQKQNQTEIKKL